MVKTGQSLKVEKLAAEEGKKVVFDKVLLTADDDGSNVKIGSPHISGATVEATLEKQGRYKTVRVEKYKRKVRYHKVHGQRQKFSEVKIS